jgi:hypothetical protein
VTQPEYFEVNQDGRGRPLYLVNEPGPGVVFGSHVNEYGQAAHLVDYPTVGAAPVFFENGPPPGSSQWYAQEALRQQQQHAAWAAAQGASRRDTQPGAATLLLLLGP